MTTPLAAEIAASLAFDFQEMPYEEVQRLFPGYQSSYGALELFGAFATFGHAFVNRHMANYPNFYTPDGLTSFWDVYEAGGGGILVYDIPPVLWDEWTELPESDDAIVQLAHRTYQRLITPPATPDLSVLVSQALAL